MPAVVNSVGQNGGLAGRRRRHWIPDEVLTDDGETEVSSLKIINHVYSSANEGLHIRAEPYICDVTVHVIYKSHHPVNSILFTLI